jgi:hypothetical protein
MANEVASQHLTFARLSANSGIGILVTGTSEFNAVSMPVALPLKKMSRGEKLRAMEALWADLSQDEDRFESPLWHAHGVSGTGSELTIDTSMRSKLGAVLG